MTRLLKDFVPPMDLLTFRILLWTIMASKAAVNAIQTETFTEIITARLFPSLLQFLGANPDEVDQFMTSLSSFISTSIGADPKMGFASVPTALLNTIIQTWIKAFVSTFVQAMEGYNQ